ncbi:Uncharacterized protein conserved in bacteria [Cronobacter sakazakii]|nr:Uncharacterized protein conserved in bacteria [Cronobacter sakazakii]
MKSLLVVMLALLLASPVSYALTLDEARAQGRVSETFTGYLAPVAQDAETAALVARINQARLKATATSPNRTDCRSMKWRKWQGRSWWRAVNPANMCAALMAVDEKITPLLPTGNRRRRAPVSGSANTLTGETS